MFIAYNERTGDVSPLATKSKAADSPKSGGAEGVEGAIGKSPRRLRRGEIPAQQYRNRLKRAGSASLRCRLVISR